jgi:hypothetical protein
VTEPHATAVLPPLTHLGEGPTPRLSFRLSCYRPRTFTQVHLPSSHAWSTSANAPEPANADLESGLGASPRGFESRILRGRD